MKIGIDIGGTSVKGILLKDNEILKEYSLPTHGGEGREAIIGSAFGVIDKLICDEVTIIGVSSAGNIDPINGRCVYATDNLKGWTGFNIKEAVESRYTLPCLVDNDAVCALKAELCNYPSVKSAVMVTFGTGIGGAVLSGGKIVRGQHYDGGRLGHSVLVPNGLSCNCGKQGCAEVYLSCTALRKRALKNCKDIVGVKELIELYKKGDKFVNDIFNEFSFYLNVFLDNIRTFISPEVIILGGGLANDSETLMSFISDRKDVRIAKYGNNAGAIGSLIEKY